MSLRKLTNKHEVWYIDGNKKMSKTLKETGKAVKHFEREGWFVLSANIERFEEGDEVVYTATIIVDKSYKTVV